MGGLAEKKLTVWQKRVGKIKKPETEPCQQPPFPPYFTHFSAIFACFSSIFCPMLRLAGQFDTKERFISLAEQNWMNLAPLREYLFGKTGLSDWKKDIVGSP